MASNALLDWVILYFRVPQRLLSDRRQEFTGQVWEELLKALRIHALTSSYHPEGKAINERSHHTRRFAIRWRACTSLGP